MGDVIAQYFLFDAAQCGADGTDLRHDVDAVAFVLNHAGETAHLPFNPVQPFEGSRLVVFCHQGYIPPRGITGKALDWCRRNITVTTRLPRASSIPSAA